MNVPLRDWIRNRSLKVGNFVVLQIPLSRLAHVRAGASSKLRCFFRHQARWQAVQPRR